MKNWPLSAQYVADVDADGEWDLSDAPIHDLLRATKAQERQP